MVGAILGEKIRQTQRFDSENRRIPVTEIKAGPCFVVQIKKGKVQLGFGQKKEKNVKKPVLGHIKKAGLKIVPRFLKEVEAEGEEIKIGEEIRVGDIFKAGDFVDVIGVSKGKGFSGVVKRWGFAGGPRTHGQSDRERAPGSIGSTTTPGRVLKGKKMAGRAGGKKVTIKNLKVLAVDEGNNLLLVKGLVPGVRKGLLVIRKSKKIINKKEEEN